MNGGGNAPDNHKENTTMLSNLDIFSDDQAVTATAVSTNYVDVGTFAGQGEPIDLLVKVKEAFNNLTTLQVQVQQCDTTGGTYTTVAETPAIPLASLVAGYKFKLQHLPDVKQRYIKLNYVVVGTAPTTGKIFAACVPDGADAPIVDGLYFSPTNPTGAAATA